MSESEPGPLGRLTPSFIRRSYTVKFVVSILLVVVVIASVGLVSFGQAQQTVRADTEESLEATVEIQSADLEAYFNERQAITTGIASADAVQSGSSAEVDSYLLQQSFGESVFGVYVVDLNSNEVVAADTNFGQTFGVGSSLGEVDRPWADGARFDGLGGGQARTIAPAYQSSEGQYVVATLTTTSINDRGVVVVSNVGPVLRGLPQAQTGSGSTTVVDADGNPVASAAPSNDATAVDTSVGPAAAGELAGFARVGETRFVEGQRRVYAATPLQAAGTNSWTVVTSVPTSEAFAVVNAVGQSIAAIIALSLISLGAIGLVLGRQTVTPLSELRRKVERMEEGDLDVDLTSSRRDEIGQLYAGFGSMRDSLQERIGEIQETNRRLETKADEYSDVMRACAEGDLTRRMDPGSRDDSMSEIALEFNTMIGQLEETTERIKNFSYEVAISSQEVTASADLVRDASGQVSDSVREINDGAERQSESLEEVTDDLNTLSRTTDEIATSSNEVALVAGETVETGREGREAAQEAVDDMDRVTEDSREAVEEIRKLEAETQQIDELLEFINEIAQRTNMLALNANIEANRTAEGGDESGFGVIANEIKQLSEEAQQATENIEQRLERIQAQTADAAEVVEETSREVQSSASNVRDAVRALEEITEYAEATNEGIKSISAANENQVESTAEVAEQVEEVADISQRTSEESETVAALAEEQSGATERMSESAGSLNERAQQLSETLDDFETDADAAPETAGAVDDAAATGASFGDEPTAAPAPDADEGGAVGASFAPDDATADSDVDPDGADGNGAVFSPAIDEAETDDEDADAAVFSPDVEDE
jgi:methyl-accepting chemotaxis protein